MCPGPPIVGVAVAGEESLPDPGQLDQHLGRTGPVDGAYARFAARYREILAREGIELELRATGRTT